MAPLTVLVNTFFGTSKDYSVDIITKIFIICELPLGIVKLPILGNVKKLYVFISAIYAFILTICLITSILAILFTKFQYLFCTLAVFQYVFFVFFNFISNRRLQLYYKALNHFDAESRTLKIGKDSIFNIIRMFISLAYILFIVSLPSLIYEIHPLDFKLLPIVLTHVFELYYIGHLFTLLIPRLRLINYCMELSLSNTKPKEKDIAFFGNVDTINKSLLKMEKIMNLYHTVIKAYGHLYDSIKWQLLVTLMATFMGCLCLSYQVLYNVIHRNDSMSLIAIIIGQIFGVLSPLFAPCIQGDKLHGEVRRLRELLASRLYENELEKCSREIARALLAWTNTRDLSFTLLRVLNIDISLPFKFLGLLITYLIILLQFEKVINP